MPIQILEPTVAAQIAAGEVVERPASVVRELLENALDAGAQRISVEVQGGGLREIRVQDDGAGIPADQIELAFARHATSKLTNTDDLWSIGTLGFRGEALPSIASVAQVVCISRTVGEELGVELRIAGGELQARSPVGGVVGTSISVRNLFYNTPVRREFLRSEAAESAAIVSLVTQYALAYPERRFTLLVEGRTVVQTSGDGDLLAVLIELYGLEIARQMLPVAYQQGQELGEVQVRGFVSPPGLTRATRNGVHLCINRRVIAARGALAMVVEEAYHTLLIKGRHPLVVLNIGVHPAAVDVNIHPAKSEVKFRDAPRVYGAVGRAVRDALLASGAQLWDADAGEAETARRRFELRRFGERWPEPAPLPTRSSAWVAGSWMADASEHPPAELRGATPMQAGEQAADAPAPHLANPITALRVLGQVGLAYILAEAPDGIVLIDQHAAHVRILTEQHTAGWPAQPCEPPMLIELSDAAHTTLLAQQEALQQWGWQLEEFGMAVRIRAIPAGLASERVAATLALIAERQRSAAEQWAESIPELLAGQAALRAGQQLSQAACEALVAQLRGCAEPLRSPQGRPTLVLVDHQLIEREFGDR